MRFRRSLGTALLCCHLLSACAETAAERPDRYIVRPQDTLYGIAWRHDVDYRDLARWNNIGADYRISVGQILMLGPHGPPRAGTMAPSITATSLKAPLTKPSIKVPTIQVPPIKVPPIEAPSGEGSPSAAAAPTSGSSWVWPTDRAGEPRPVPGGGILLSGRLGQDIRAASGGRVVYSGSGLRGYGNLIIIKHADNLLSAYAHNREMLVHDGALVQAGQVIAHMGQSAQQLPVLYFELRQNGRPIDPLLFLPK